MVSALTFYICMKRYIRYINASIDVDIDTSIFDGTPFKCDTDTSYYNDFLNNKELAYMQKNKNRTGKVLLMSPKDYIEECAAKIFNGRVSSQDLIDQRNLSKAEDDTRLIDTYVTDMKHGDKFPLCYLNYPDHSQEGLHRMIAAGEAYGWDTEFPVLVVTAFDPHAEEVAQDRIELKNFLYFDFNDICDTAVNNIADPHMKMPSNITSILRDEVISVANSYEEHYDIDVVVELANVSGRDTLMVYVSRFGTYDMYGVDEYPEPYSILVADMFATGETVEPTQNQDWGLSDEELDALLDDIDLDDIDLSDSGIAKLFFRDSQ